MRLSRITISNFKGLKAAEFEPTSFGCLVGENNTGKSSVLQAIAYALNSPSQLPIDLFYDATIPVVLSLDLDGVTPDHLRRLAEEHRAKIEDLVVDEGLKLFIRYSPGQKCEITTQKFIPTNPKYRQEAISDVLAGKRGAAVRNAVATAYPEFLDGLPEAATIANAKEHLKACIAQLPREDFEKSVSAGVIIPH